MPTEPAPDPAANLPKDTTPTHVSGAANLPRDTTPTRVGATPTHVNGDPAPTLLVDLSAWPQIQCHIPASVPLPLAISALDTILTQLRQLYAHSNATQAQIARRPQQPAEGRAVEDSAI